MIGLSMSTRKQAFVEALREVAAAACFRRTLIVASAHNLAVGSFPWRFSSVLSVVEVARAIFLARAAWIALLDEAVGDFVFEAVAGAGAGELVGMRFPGGAGIAGHVAASGEPLIVDDLTRDPRFARDVAEGTGYVPPR